MPRMLRFLLCALLAPLLAASPALLAVEPVKTHPRLLIRAGDLPELRSRMVPSNEVWVAFKEQLVDKYLTEWKCASTWVRNENGTITRTSFTDEFGVTHYPTLGDGSANPDWGEFLQRKAAPEDDTGAHTGIQPLRSEVYAMVFAFMARLLQDQPGEEAARAEYLAAARECLMNVIEPASLGHPAPDANGRYPAFRHPGFALQDRSFGSEAFALTVDWIYEDLTADELAKIRRCFLLWSYDSDHKPGYSPVQPISGVTLVNDPALLHFDDPAQVVRRSSLRWALNNHYANHARQIALYAMSFDPKDDLPSAPGDAAAAALTGYATGPGGADDWVYQGTGYLRDATGAWLYLTDYALRNDGAGGFSMEGSQYASNGLGPLALTLYCLHTAGQDDPQRWGPQVSLHRHPFWDKAIPAYLALLPPAARIHPEQTWLGPHFQPPLFGDLESYAMVNDQNIKFIAPLGLYDERVNGTNGSVAQAARYIQRHLAPGGAANLASRIASTRSEERPRDGITYFLLFDPDAPAPSDPRPQQPLTFYAPHDPAGSMGMVAARSATTGDATYFHWRLAWNRIDHQRGDSLGFGLWKNGVWFTKIMTGYGALQGCSEFRNNLALRNGSTLYSGANYEAQVEHPRGSQWSYGPAHDPEIVQRSLGETFIHFDGDATGLYNWYGQPAQQNVLHASRSIVWLKPDHVVVYDRAQSAQAGDFKRWCLNMPGTPIIDGSLASAVASDGAVEKGRLFVRTLLPAGALPVAADIESGNPSPYEDMQARVIVSAPGDPAETRFLHVVQAAGPGATQGDETQAVSSAGGGYEGAVLGNRCVLFRKTWSAPELPLSFTVPPAVTEFYLTGMERFSGYEISNSGGAVTISAGTERFSDGGGVLTFGTTEPANVEITASQPNAAEGGTAASFTLKRSGDLAAALTVNLGLDGDAGAADFAALPAAVTFGAGEGTATLLLAAADDAVFEPVEGYTLRLLPGAGYHASEAAVEVPGSVTDNEPAPGGTLAFASAAYSATEGEGQPAVITLTRSGGTSGEVSVLFVASNGSAVSGSDYTPASMVVKWIDGDSAPKQVSIPILNDGVIEADETVHLTIAQPTGESALGLAAAVLTIGDDEPPTFELSPATLAVTEGGAASAVFTVTRQGGNAATVSIGYATADGTASSPGDFTSKSGTLSWAPGAAGPQQVSVPLHDDLTYEGDSETFTFTVSNPTGGGVILGSATATVTIAENDLPPAQFQVGPGQAYATPGEVPWNAVGAGSEVLIHYRAEPYRQKLLLATRGTEALPVRITGVPGPNGERPVLDGEDAQPPPATAKYEPDTNVEDQSLIAIERSDTQEAGFKPGWIEIRGLELCHAHPAYSYTRQPPNAGTDAYGTGAAAIFLRGAEHVRISDCVIHHCAGGIATNYGGNSEAGLVRDLVIERCHFHSQGSSAPNTYYGLNLLTQTAGLTIQFCRLDPPLTGTAVPNVEDRSASFLARCNWVEGGGSQFNLAEPYSAAPLLTDDPGWSSAQLTGNILRSLVSGAGSMIQFGGSEVAGPRTLHLHHNSVHAANGYSRTLVNVRSAEESALVFNNAVRHSGVTEFHLLGGSGSAQYGRNCFSPGFATPVAAVTGAGNILTSAASPFTNEGGGDYLPPLGSPLIDNGVALPAGAVANATQYVPHALGMHRSQAGAAPDLGALERGAVSPGGYDAWIFEAFGEEVPSSGGEAMDPDGDGAPNLIEYALGLQPGLHEADWTPAMGLVSDALQVTVHKSANATGISFAVEVSTDLVNWSGAGLNVLSDTSTELVVRDSVPAAGSARRFVRVRVTRQ